MVCYANLLFKRNNRFHIVIFTRFKKKIKTILLKSITSTFYETSTIMQHLLIYLSVNFLQILQRELTGNRKAFEKLIRENIVKILIRLHFPYNHQFIYSVSSTI